MQLTKTNLASLFQRLNHSKFRYSIMLNHKDYAYLQQKGLHIIKKHAEEFICYRLASAYPNNDGKQTPWKGHPVFVAQHATATCCRGCLSKWHNIEIGKPLTQEQQKYIVEIIMYWLAFKKVKKIKMTSKNLSLL